MGAEVTFVIDKKGEIKLEVTGVSGASCAEVTRAFEEGLGIKVDSQVKPEYYVELEGQKNEVHEGDE